MTDKQFSFIIKHLYNELSAVLDNYVIDIPDPDNERHRISVVCYNDLSERLNYYFSQLIDIDKK